MARMTTKPSRFGRKPKNELRPCCSESPILTAARVFIELLLESAEGKAPVAGPWPAIGVLGGLSGDARVSAADAVGAVRGLSVRVGDVDLLLAHGLADL